jgi:hypothetical protein
MSHELEKALENLARDGDMGPFGLILGESSVHVLTSSASGAGDDAGEAVSPARAQVEQGGHGISVVPVFGTRLGAMAFLRSPGARLLGDGQFAVKEMKGRNVLFSVAARGLFLWLDPRPAGKEKLDGGRLFSPPETLALIGSATSGQASLAAQPVAGPKTVPAIQDLDLSRSRTLDELGDIFHDEIPSELGLRLSRLVERGVIAECPSPFDKNVRLYEPLAAFYLGFGSDSARGREFRDWFKRLMAVAYLERGNLAREILALASENRDLKKELEFSESFKQKVKREYQKLKARMEDEQRTSLEAMDSVLSELENEKCLRRKDGTTIEGLFGKVAQLENDIRASEAWPYPRSLGEVLSAAEKLYSSKLAVAPGDHRVEVSDPAMERHQGLTAEAVRMVKALALDLYPMKFNFGNLNRDRFREYTGLELTMPDNGNAAASSTMCTRRVEWRGRSFVCNNYLQGTKDNCRLLIHFKLLDDERKILVSHFTVFAISGLFKLVPGHD